MLKLVLKSGIHEREKRDSCLLLAEVVQNPGEMKSEWVEGEEGSPHAIFYVRTL